MEVVFYGLDDELDNKALNELKAGESIYGWLYTKGDKLAGIVPSLWSASDITKFARANPNISRAYFRRAEQSNAIGTF
ncbi:hypothetical protein [Campylobacter curvus]|uniref:hypothetical protein n=1 Tax=Campylobacter curvus TaxID=200 RepID=UPI00146FE457|nr:hypothetical protein [Campylobacter curvus]